MDSFAYEFEVTGILRNSDLGSERGLRPSVVTQRQFIVLLSHRVPGYKRLQVVIVKFHLDRLQLNSAEMLFLC